MDDVRVTVAAVAHGGHCVARHQGRVIFVRHTLPGEEVTVRLTDSEPDAKFWRGDAIEVHVASPDRVESAWPEAGPGGVGGAELAHVKLEAQLRWKQDVLTESFGRFADRMWPGQVAQAPGDDARGGLRYRTRITAVADGSGQASMREPRSHTMKALAAMPLATEPAEAALLKGRFPAGAAIQVVAPAHEDRAHVLVNGAAWKSGKPDARPNAPTSVREKVDVAGTEYAYRVATGGFWQVHVEAPAILVAEVLARVGAAATVLDLYAGSGLFTLPLATGGREVVSVESDGVAVRNALRNLHDQPSATVIEGDVRRTLGAGMSPAAAAVVDPPRSGAGKATLEALAAVGPARVVYVACDPVALARDTQILGQLGYDLVDAAGWDLYPMTHHVEAVATFERR